MSSSINKSSTGIDELQTSTTDRVEVGGMLIEKSSSKVANCEKGSTFASWKEGSKKNEQQGCGPRQGMHQIVGQIKEVDSQLPNWRAARSPLTPSPYLRTGGK